VLEDLTSLQVRLRCRQHSIESNAFILVVEVCLQSPRFRLPRLGRGWSAVVPTRCHILYLFVLTV
jgi:hypothetical protein